MAPSVRAYAPSRSSKSRPRAPPPDPRLKPGPLFVASRGVSTLDLVIIVMLIKSFKNQNASLTDQNASLGSLVLAGGKKSP